jgi:hypothetical protein
MLTTYRLRFGNEVVAVVKGKDSMTKDQIKEQARLDAELALPADRVPGVFSKIHYASIEQDIPRVAVVA